MSDDKTTAWLDAQIDDHSPEQTEDAAAVFRLAEACAALGGAPAAAAFGLALPADIPERDRLKEKGVAALKRWIPKLDPESVTRLKAMLAEYRLSGTGGSGESGPTPSS